MAERGQGVNRAQAAIVARSLLKAGCTLWDVANYLRAHPRAVAALLA